MQLPHIFRNIFRIVIILVIIGAAGYFVIQKNTRPIINRVSQEPRDMNLRLEYARGLESQGRVDDARRQLTVVLDFDPLNPYATSFYNELGAKSVNLEGQIKALREILARRPDYQKAWIKLATLYEYAGKTVEAEAARQKALELSKKL